MQISLGCYPIVSRNDISNRFSLADYAQGKFTKGTSSAGGIW